MLTSYKVKIEEDLLNKLKRCSEAGGYASVDEFVLHVLEKETDKILRPDDCDSESREIIKKRLKGLGYID